jgi:Tol biopolymer transport system component
MEGEGGLAEMPDGKLIFSRRDNKEVNLWQADKDGRNPQKLTNGSRYNSYPVVTPDGRFIIFSSNRSGGSRIWRMEPDGKNPVQLTQGDQMSGDFEPLLLPDGKNIIFHRHSKANDKSFLLKISIEGGEAAPIHAEDDFANFMPTLSPDGKHLAFVTFNTVNFKKFLRVMSFDGERVGEIEKDFEYNLIGKFAWSPDSKSITYLGVEGIPNLWRLPLDGGKPQPLTDFKSGRIFNFTWSRDGKKLFIVRGVVNNDLILIRDAARAGD